MTLGLLNSTFQGLQNDKMWPIMLLAKQKLLLIPLLNEGFNGNCFLGAIIIKSVINAHIMANPRLKGS